MNPNFQNPFTQKEKSPEYPPFSKIQKNSNTLSNPHLSPINRVSILKTEEQKEIVRTNVYADNDSSGNKKEFCVVTEIIRRKSNIPLPSKNNTQINLNPFRFSFNQAIKEPPFNPNLNIDIKDSKLKQSQKLEKNDNYNEIVKRIASQLNVHIRPPSQGFFYFAMLKGNYPLMIIKKLEKDIVNHKIELNNDIFRIYSEKYMRYIELVKKIAHLLKANLKNKMFWENERFKNESIQVKVINKNTSDNANVNNANVNNANAKMNSHDHNANNANKKNNNTNIKSNLHNKKQINGKNSQINQNNNNNNQRKVKSHITKTNINNNNKNSLSNPTDIKNNFGSHRLNNVVNPFNAIKTQNQNQNHKKGNATKKPETNLNKNNLNHKSFRNKNVNNHQKNEDARSASSETNKTGKIKFTNNPKIPIMENKEENNLKEDAKNNSEKTQVIKISKKTVNNATFNIQNSFNADNDIEMKDETNIINQEIQNGTNVDSVTNNMKTIPHRNTATIMNIFFPKFILF